MSLQFLLGASGSGKSYELNKWIIQESMAHPEQNFMVIVPEQFTMQTQKDLVMAHPNKGIMNIDVLSFVRLAHRIFEEVGGGDQIILDDVGKNLVLRKVASDCKGQLQVLGSNLKRIGYISEVKSILSEFTQYDISAEQLAEFIEELGEGSSLSYKLQDIQLLFVRFQEYMEGVYITKEELLDVLAHVVSQSDLLANTTIALDGFTGFTPVQNRLIRELMRRCRKVLVSVTTDEKEPFFGKSHPYQIFALSKEMASNLIEIAKEEHCEILKPVVQKGHPVYRYRENKELAFLEETLFRDRQEIWSQGVPEHVHVLSSRSPKEEVRMAAGTICNLVRQGWHYRDIAVVTSDIGGYADDVEEVFRQYEIPLFLDYKRNVLSNAFVEYVRSLLAMADEQYSYESVFRFLRTGLFSFQRNQIDSLENYVLAVGIRGFKQWQQPWNQETRQTSVEKLDELNHLRVQFVEQLDPLMQVLRKRKKTVGDITRALYEFLESQGLQEKMTEREENFRKNQEEALAKEYAQIYQIVINLFDQFVELLEEESVSLEEYRQLLDAGFTEAKIGVIPPNLDLVVVGDLTRTRIAGVKALIFLGADERRLPGNLSAEGLLSEWDRELFEKANLKLSSGMREKVFQQKFYLYQTLSKPTDQLYISFSVTDGGEKSQRASYLIEELMELFPELTVEDYVGQSAVEEMTPESGVEYLIGSMEERTDLWELLFDWYRNQDSWRETLQMLVQAHVYRCPTDRLSQRLARTLYGEKLKGSVTRLEKYASCAFAHFMDYGIRLQDREEYGFEDVDFGIVLHDALDRYGKALQEQELSWVGLDEKTQEMLMKNSIRESMKDYGNTVLDSSARMSYMQIRMEKMMKRTIWALTSQLAKGDFRPMGYEVDFGSGKIDRIDACREDDKVYVKVVDYKTGKKSFDMTALYHGQQLQLILYMDQAMKLAEETYPDAKAVPAGIFYYQVQDPIVEKMPTQAKLEEAILKGLRMKGIINEQEAVLTHLDHAPGTQSLVAPFGVKNNGELAANSKTIPEEDFTVLMEYGKQKKTNLEQEILDGNVEIRPQVVEDKSPCTFCPYQHICKFDDKVPGYECEGYGKEDESTLLEKMRQEVTN